LPPRWTIHALVRESARLAGCPRRDLDAVAVAALRALQLDALARTRLGGCEPAVRRAAVLAAALATGAETLLVCDFTRGLPDAAARSLARLFVAACQAKRWVLFTGQLSLSSPLGLHADEALVFAGGRLVCTGSPAEVATRDRTYSVRTTGEGAPAFATRLRERGAVVDGDAAALSLTVTLPAELSTLDLVTMAQAGQVTVLELLPVSGSLV
jgi:ABC-type Na+ transport system ATPase subunit NatA